MAGVGRYRIPESRIHLPDFSMFTAKFVSNSNKVFSDKLKRRQNKNYYFYRVYDNTNVVQQAREHE